MANVQRVVVALDRSLASTAALCEAVRIAAWDRAQVCVLHVIDAPPAPDPDALEGVAGLNVLAEHAPHEKLDISKTYEEFRKLTAPALREGSDVQVRVRAGDAFTEILVSMRECEADVLVMGATGDSATGVGVGALAARCVRRAPGRVLLVREATPGPFRRILAAIDLSENSPRVLEQAARIACQDHSRLDIVHAYAPLLDPIGEAASSELTQRYQAAVRRRVDALLAPIQAEMHYLHGETHVVERADGRTGVIEYAHRIGCDLVVLGTQGRSETPGPLIGTTAERIVRDAPCSVLAIKPPGFANGQP